MIVDPVELIRNTYRIALPNKFDSRAANVMLVAIGLQESNFMDRYQLKGGPARGFWQFERHGGVKGVLTHHSVEHYAKGVCAIRKVAPAVDAVHQGLVTDDILACAFARLLLWTDPRAIPTDEAEAWKYYLRIWRPGKPRENHWPGNWEQAEAMWK